MQYSSLNFKKTMFKPLRKIIALFFLIFVLTDLTVVDVLFPDRCGGEMFGLQDVTQTVSGPSVADGALSSYPSYINTQNNQNPILPTKDDSCCFCCCTHLLLQSVLFLVSSNVKTLTNEILHLSQPSSPPKNIFHPPRLF